MTDRCTIGSVLAERFSEHSHGQGPLLVEIEQAECSGPYKPLIVCEREAKKRFSHGAILLHHDPNHWAPIRNGGPVQAWQAATLPLTGPDSILSRLTVDEMSICEGHRALVEPSAKPCHDCGGDGCAYCNDRGIVRVSPRLSLTELLRVPCPNRLDGIHPPDRTVNARPCYECDNTGTIPHPALQAALDKARGFGLVEEVRT